MCEPDLCNSVSEGYQKSFSIYALGNLAFQCGSHFKVHQKPQRSLLNMHIPGVRPQNCQTSTMMFIATVFTGAIKKKNPSINLWMKGRNKMWHILTMNYFSTLKMKEILTHATTQMNPEDII